MGEWSADSRTRVATMGEDDFASHEKSVVIKGDDTLTIQLVDDSGQTTVLKDGITVLDGEVVDATFLDVKALNTFLSEQVELAKSEDLLFSIHLKATMMKVSDPIIFGHAVRAFLPAVFAEHGDALREAGLSPNDGLAAILSGLKNLPAETADAVRSSIDQGLTDGPDLAMVDSRKGITNPVSYTHLTLPTNREV